MAGCLRSTIGPLTYADQSPAACFRTVAALGVAIALLATIARPSDARADDERIARAHGWGYLIDKLAADGVAPSRVAHTFGDPRLPPFTGLSFSLHPGESGALYRSLLRPASVAEARRCKSSNASAFGAAERTYGVPASVVAAIIHVESHCGHNTGTQPIFYRLARLAMANEPENLAANLARLTSLAGNAGGATTVRVFERARYLEDTFYPEVRAMFEMAARTDVDPLSVRGSRSGAFGYPQFLPTSYLRDGVDADGDGRVSLYDALDAAASCARYLAAHGWHPGASTAERRSAIWAYNRSTAYIDAVLTIARRLDQH